MTHAPQETPTPRTDAALVKLNFMGEVIDTTSFVRTDFARQLERELASAQARCEEWVEASDNWQVMCREQRERADALQRDLDLMKAAVRNVPDAGPEYGAQVMRSLQERIEEWCKQHAEAIAKSKGSQ